MTTQPVSKAQPPTRLLSVDVFRGLTLVLMILVNNPGNWGTVYPPLLHADWHGWTLTDLVFPFFLFIVGVSIVLALGWRREAGTADRELRMKILRRGAILFALGLLLSGYPFGLFGPRSFERLLETWRIPGVLQRIGLCYTAAALLFLCCRRRTLVWTTGGLLVGYWLLLSQVPAPGSAAPDLASKGDHLAGWLDRVVLGNHLWSSAKVYDPEGILSTLPAIATTLLGVLVGLVLKTRLAPWEKLSRLFIYGSTWVAIGYVWSWFLPINKALWTSSYAMFTAGQATCCLALCFWFFDLREHDALQQHRALAQPLRTFGLNAITVFVGSGLLAKTMLYLKPGGKSLHAWLYSSCFSSWLPPYVASLAFALAWVVGWYVVLRFMERRGWVLKV